MTQPDKTILLLSAYRSSSHAAWANWLTETFSEYNWIKLELPGRYFRWRIRGNPLSWLDTLENTQPDLILATSMVDLSTIKGLHPHLSHVPCVYYFHENQFAYPTSQQQHASIDPQMVQLYGALSADKCLFNSTYNKHSFLSGIDALLKKLPDEVPKNIVSRLKTKSEILPVAISPVEIFKTEQAQAKNPQLILWNHRWEYDKAPDIFVDALEQLEKTGIEFQLALLGDRADKTPASLLKIEKMFHHRIIANGKVSKQEYNKILSLASIVVSTAIHEFQGLSILEAVTAGAIPIVPNDLCYKEQYADIYRYSPDNPQALVEKLRHFLNPINRPTAPDVSFWSSQQLKQAWHQLLNEK